MPGNPFENLVENLVKEFIQDTPLELVDVEYVKERDWYLRVFLDKPGGLEVEDCQSVSEHLGKCLDELDPVKDAYILEVSSPGLDRPLKKDKDFVRHAGDKVEVKTFAPIDGKKIFIGTLVGLENQDIHIDIDGIAMTIPRDKTSQVRLHLDF
ncbi:MAG: ribosome maturation factor RimP [Negativicutes bacterium]|nr:ribosome maturation factor RimP [Negativicutes bacterium]